MSRSVRRTPIMGRTTAESDKDFKRLEHRRERAAVRGALAYEEDPPGSRAFGSRWASPKDGRQWFGGHPNAAVWLRK